ncbi:hypothetical protein P4S63_02065 [Pseudoalteromonas sp. B193]
MFVFYVTTDLSPPSLPFVFIHTHVRLHGLSRSVSRCSCVCVCVCVCVCIYIYIYMVFLYLRRLCVCWLPARFCHQNRALSHYKDRHTLSRSRCWRRVPRSLSFSRVHSFSRANKVCVCVCVCVCV